MKITNIKQQLKNPERASIFVDSQYSFSISLDELIKYKLKNNDELTSADVKKYKKISADGKLRARTLEWLLNRPHSERELRDYLYRKKAEPEQIEKFVNEFIEKDYLNNAKFAQWFSELQARKGKSNRAILAELIKKGISRELIDQSLQEQGSSEAKRLKELAAKKAKLSRYKDNPQKLMQYLVGKGFDWQLVKEVIAKDRSDLDT
jgi:regulatory protein